MYHRIPGYIFYNIYLSCMITLISSSEPSIQCLFSCTSGYLCTLCFKYSAAAFSNEIERLMGTQFMNLTFQVRLLMKHRGLILRSIDCLVYMLANITIISDNYPIIRYIHVDCMFSFGIGRRNLTPDRYPFLCFR